MKNITDISSSSVSATIKAWVLQYKTRVPPVPTLRRSRTSIKLLQNVCVSAPRGHFVKVVQFKEFELIGF